MPDVPITVLSFAYPEASMVERSDAVAALGSAEAALERVASLGREAFILSTCLRLDVAVVGHPTDLGQVAEVLLGEAAASRGRVRVGTEAVIYLFRVAAGLESAVKGEDDILVQYRQAFDAAVATGALRSSLPIKTFERAIAAGRRSRDLMQRAGHRSLAQVAADRVAGASEVAVFGAGAMGRSVVEALIERPDHPHITVVVRRPHQVQLPEADVRGMEAAVETLRDVDAVVVATAAKGKLLQPGEFETALGQRTSRLTLVDMAVPADLPPPPDADVDYFDIDHLSDSAEDPEDVRVATEFVEDAARDAARTLVTNGEVGPVISSLLARGDAAAAEVADRFARKFEGADKELVAQVTRAVARSILHDPVSNLRKNRRSRAELDLVRELFDVTN